jgi:hypothetical protein
MLAKRVGFSHDLRETQPLGKFQHAVRRLVIYCFEAVFSPTFADVLPGALVVFAGF